MRVYYIHMAVVGFRAWVLHTKAVSLATSLVQGNVQACIQIKQRDSSSDDSSGAGPTFLFETQETTSKVQKCNLGGLSGEPYLV